MLMLHAGCTSTTCTMTKYMVNHCIIRPTKFFFLPVFYISLFEMVYLPVMMNASVILGLGWSGDASADYTWKRFGFYFLICLTYTVIQKTGTPC